jgi:hypothetical protein
MNSKTRWTTTLKFLDGPRRDIFAAVFPDAIVPIQSVAPIKADLPDHPNADVYMLDLDAISDGQRTALIFTLAKRFGASMQEVQQEMSSKGVPILAEGVSVLSNDVWDLRQFI